MNQCERRSVGGVVPFGQVDLSFPVRFQEVFRDELLKGIGISVVFQVVEIDREEKGVTF